MKVLVVGYGFMGRALGDAWRQSGVAASVLAVDPAFTESTSNCFADFSQLLAAHGDARFDVVVLAVKPAVIRELLAAMPATLFAGGVVLSVAAGVRMSTLTAALPVGTPVARAMPNTPVAAAAGCTALFASPDLDASGRDCLTRLFRAVGVAFWLDSESQLDAVTAISGSGPAYYHLFSEALEQAALALDLPPGLAHALVANTAWGAATLQKTSEADFSALRTAVTSPHGTTAAAIAVLEAEPALRERVRAAVFAAHRRAHELSQ